MDSTHGGVSRSGRVRKKPAKLMEMELSTDDRSLSMSSSDRPTMTASNYVASKTAALSSALMGCSPVLHSGPTSPPLMNMPSATPQTQHVRKQAVRSTTLPIVQRVQPPPQPASRSSAAVSVQDTPGMMMVRATEDRETQQSPRVIAIKAMDTSPSFDNLSGSTYLIGDDVHFITGEPVDSESEQVDDIDDDQGHQQRGYRLSPLKLDVGGHVIDEAAAAASAAAARSSVVNQDDGGGDGLRMKFILSPKNSSSSSLDKAKGNQSKSKKSKKSSRSHSKKSSSSGGGGSKSKKKKKSKQNAADDQEHQSPPNLYPSDSFRGMPVLEVLAAGGGGILPHTFHGTDSDSDNVDDESNLIIAEPPVLQPMVPIGKSKSSWSTKATKSRKKGGGSSSRTVQKQQVSYDGEEIFGGVPMAAEVLGQQHSVYLKEKNASKKKSGKKAAKAREDKGAIFKARPQSAYMLWCREYRSHIVQENPGIDFATISKRLGEVWQSLSEFDKMNWRRKAKVSSCKEAATGTSNLINTGKKRTDSASSSKQVAGGGGGGGGGGGNINSSKVPHKGPQTGSAAANAASAAAQRASDEAAAAGQLAITRPVGTTPLDVAAHLKLLGESLSIIGQRLTEHEGQIAVSGSLSVLLDSTLCALGPLVCLSSEVDQLNGCAKSIQERILDNIAYIMPGL